LNYNNKKGGCGVRAVGIHIRVTQTLAHVFQKAIRLQLPSFQCFLIQQQTHKSIRPSAQALEHIRAIRAAYAGDVYIHGSYYINLGQTDVHVHRLLEQEMRIAYHMGGTCMILHAGYTKKSMHRLDGIDAMARVLNVICKQSNSIPIILENSAHAGMSLGSDFIDFQLLKQKIDKPEQLLFCVDTAHAHAFGYDLMTNAGQESLITLLEITLGRNAIALIHLNDTTQERGSYIDQHAMLGEGIIGLDLLKRFVSHDMLQGIPIILELPVVDEYQERVIIDLIRSW
jgi:apurinic endonuclease APN1